jgi:hypothetical protein
MLSGIWRLSKVSNCKANLAEGALLGCFLNEGLYITIPCSENMETRQQKLAILHALIQEIAVEIENPLQKGESRPKSYT